MIKKIKCTIKKLYNRLLRPKLYEQLNKELENLKYKTLQHNLHWKDPYACRDDYDKVDAYEFFGNGKQGEEPARFMLSIDDNEVWSFWTSRYGCSHNISQNHFLNYLTYLKINKWISNHEFQKHN